MKRIIWSIVLVLSIALAVVATINIYQLNKEYQTGKSEYADLEQYTTIVEKEEQDLQYIEASDVQEEKKSVIPVTIEADFQKLKAINEDFVGWIYYEPLEINYPIARGDDNDFYTVNTFEKTRNSSGAIFMDFLNKPDMSNYNTIIYGHNMKNGTMFGSLKKLINDNAIIKENPYFYIYTEEKSYMYEIASCYITDNNSTAYNLIKDEQDQKIYIKYIKDSSEYYWDKDILATDKIVTLSTCHGLHSKNRTVVHGVLVAEEDR